MAVIGTAQQNVSRVVRLLMTDLSVTSDALAEALDMSPEAVRSKRTGRRSWTIDEVCALAQVFDLPITAFLGEPDWTLLRHARFGAAVNSDRELSDQNRKESVAQPTDMHSQRAA